VASQWVFLTCKHLLEVFPMEPWDKFLTYNLEWDLTLQDRSLSLNSRTLCKLKEPCLPDNIFIKDPNRINPTIKDK
jgi:hypothetical protein